MIHAITTELSFLMFYFDGRWSFKMSSFGHQPGMFLIDDSLHGFDMIDLRIELIKLRMGLSFKSEDITIKHHNSALVFPYKS